MFHKDKIKWFSDLVLSIKNIIIINKFYLLSCFIKIIIIDKFYKNYKVFFNQF